MSFASLCTLIATILFATFPDGEPSEGESFQVAVDNDPLARMSGAGGMPSSAPQTGLDRASLHLTPREVFGNPDCRIVSSRGTALLLIPAAEEGARFSAVGSGGVLHSGELDFWPRTIDVAERSDGSVLAAFGDLERAEPGRPGPDAKWPVRIYLDGQPLIEHEDMWHFGLAGDGSSYYLVEPLAGDTSRLLIHSIDEGTERAHDLGDLATSSASGEYSYVPEYTLDYSEINLVPTFDGVGTHYFYPVGGERRDPIKVRLHEEPEKGGMSVRAALFASSRLGYVAYGLRGSGGRFLVNKVERGGGGSSAEMGHVWGQTLLRREAAPESMTLSPDGKVLMLYGLNILLIDTQTGESVFKWPVGDKEAQLPRLRSVLGPDAGAQDVGSVRGSISLTNKRLYIGRSYRLGNNAFERRALDVFDLEGIELDSSPVRRDPYPSPSDAPPCSPEALFGRLGERDGQLVFE